jgi:hypothetical protein
MEKFPDFIKSSTGSFHFSEKASLNIYFTFHLYYLGVHFMTYSADYIAVSKSNS